MTTFVPPVVATYGATDSATPLVVLLHGRGSNEREIPLARSAPSGRCRVRRGAGAPIGEGGGFAWFANRGIGRPVAESLAATMGWLRGWLDEVAPVGRPVVVGGFSGGAAFAGGLVLDEPARYAGAAILYDTASPVTPDYTPETSHFTGRIEWVQIDIDQASEDGDHHITPEERLRVAMARQ